MRYANPTTDSRIRALMDKGCDRILLLPLYPQYSFATTRSSLKEWRRVFSRASAASPAPREIVVEEFHLHPQYIAALVRNVETALARFADRRDAHLVFSAHGLPLSLIARGDPYQRHVQETVAAVVRDAFGRTVKPLALGARIAPTTR